MASPETKRESARPTAPSLAPLDAGAVEMRLRELLRPEGRPELETFRFPGSTNRVYHIPIGADGAFTVVKLPAEGRTKAGWKRIKHRLRNAVYQEHDRASGARRVEFEIERFREWQAAGLAVPPLIEVSLRGVRAFQGLPYPTFLTLLMDPVRSLEEQFETFRRVTASLSLQHARALDLAKQGLVHRDSGPWNTMVDVQQGHVYWFDLEQPGVVPGATIPDLMVRALRIYLYGVLDHLGDHLPRVAAEFVDTYEHHFAVQLLIKQLKSKRVLAFVKAGELVGMRRGRSKIQQALARELSRALARTAVSSESTLDRRQPAKNSNSIT
jgi:hypothetical protein